MNDRNRERGLLGTMVIWLLVGMLAIIALKVALAIAGALVHIGLFALFTLGPVLLVGWLVLKGLRHFAGGGASL